MNAQLINNSGNCQSIVEAFQILLARLVDEGADNARVQSEVFKGWQAWLWPLLCDIQVADLEAKSLG